MTRRNKVLFLLLAVILLLGLSFGSSEKLGPAVALPYTGAPVEVASAPSAVLEGKGKTAIHVSVPGKFSFTVVQSGNAAPSSGGVVGQYAEAKKRNNVGLIAHNYLAGANFFILGFGDEVIVTYSDGTTQTFVVKNIKKFQATDPYNYGKPFIQNNGKGSQVNTRNVFNKVYKAGGLTFQTCIAKDGIDTWGLMFVIAVPKK